MSPDNVTRLAITTRIDDRDDRDDRDDLSLFSVYAANRR